MKSEDPEESKLAVITLTTLYPKWTDLAVRLLELTKAPRDEHMTSTDKNVVRILESGKEKK